MKKIIARLLVVGIFGLIWAPVAQAEESIVPSLESQVESIVESQEVEASLESEVILDEDVDIDIEVPEIEGEPEVVTEPELEPQPMVGDYFEPFLDYAADPSGIKKSVGTYETDLATGAATYRYPLYLPPGRNGFQPEVFLSYNNQGVSDDSIAGYGWDVFAGGSISRTQEYGFEDIYSTNEFYLNMAGASGKLLPVELVDSEHGEYGLQIEEAFYKYEFLTDDSWVVTDKNGTEYVFGEDTDSRQDDPNDSSRIFEWRLTEVRDVLGNFVRFEYFKDQGQVYPMAIYYTGHDQDDGPVEVRFQPFYDGVQAGSERADWTKWYDKGFEVKTEWLLEEVEVVLEGDVVREYELSYGTGDNGRRSMLESIAETGTSLEGDTVTLPATEFDYSASDGEYSFSYQGIYAGESDYSHLVDVNGDGYADQAPFDDQDLFYPYAYSRLNSAGLGFGGEYFVADYLPAGLPHTPADAGFYVDMNGDAVKELIVLYDSPYPSNGCMYRNYGEGYVSNYQGCPTGTIDRETDGYRLGDMNGDSLLDMFTGDNEDADWTSAGGDILINDAEYNFDNVGWTSPVAFSWGADEYPYYYSGEDTGARLVDFNGDGLVDIIHAYEDDANPNDPYDGTPATIDYYLNTGDGNFVLDTDFDMEAVADMWFARMNYIDINQLDESYYSTSFEMCYADFNGDGIIDLLRSSGVYLWDGVDTWTYVNHNAGDVSCGGIAWGNQTWAYGTNDVNGDGLMDFYGSHEDPNGSRGVYLNVEGKPDLLTDILTSEGSEIEISYLSALQYEDDDGFLMNPDLPFAIYTVSEVVVSDGLESEMTTSYEYAGGHYFKYFDGFTGEFSKFEEVYMIEEGVETIYYFDSGCHEGELCSVAGLEDEMIIMLDGYGTVVDGDYLRILVDGIIGPELCQDVNCFEGFEAYEDAILGILGEGEDWDDAINDTFIYETSVLGHVLKGKLMMVEVYDEVGDLYSRTVNEWSVSELGDSRYFPYLESSVEFAFEGESQARETASSYEYDEDYGLLLTETFWGEVEADEASYEIMDYMIGDEVYASYSYEVNEDDWIFREEEVLLEDGDGSILSDVQYFYDEYGLLIEESVWLDVDGSWLSTEYDHDVYGNVERVLNPRGYETTVTYDSWGFYPEIITNALLQSVEMEVNYVTGEPAWVFDYNGYEYFYTYDGLGRPLEVEGPSVDGLSTVTHVEYEYDDASQPRMIREILNDGTVDGFSTYTYVDGLGREAQIRVEGEDDYAVSNITYDERGQVDFEGLAYFSAGASYTGLDETQPGISYEYDVLGRVFEMVTPMGTTSMDYGVWEETVTDPLGNFNSYYYDAYGNLVEVFERELYTTYYGYDLLGRLFEIEDNQGNLRGFEYDSLGRLTMQEEAHDPADLTYASWEYSYDENGNMIEMTVPSGEAIAYTYDELDRILSEGNDVVFEYDTALNGVGLVASVTYEEGGVSYEYDALAGVSLESRDVFGEIFENSFENDLIGRVSEIIYPNGATVSYEFNEGSFVESVVYDGELVILDMDYSPMGQWEGVLYGNEDIVLNTYDPEQMYLLDNKITTAADGTVLQDLTYEYDDVGNVLSIIDESEMETAKEIYYGYDDLYRLTGVQAQSATGLVYYDRTYDYDSVGNMIYKSDIGDLLYEQTGNANPHALTYAGGISYEYDEAGNMVSDGEFEYVYNYKNQMTSSGVADYYYDFSGSRVVKDSGDGEVAYYPSTLYEEHWYEDGSGVLKEYVFVDGVRVFTEEFEVEADAWYQEGTTSRNNGWGDVYFGESFDVGAEVAVFAQIQSEVHSDYSHVDLKEVSEDGFSLRIEEDRGSDRSWMNGGHTYEEVGWFAVDVGNLPDGVQGGIPNFRKSWFDNTYLVTFDEPFDLGTEVIVLAEVQTENGGHTVEVEILMVDENGFEMELVENTGDGTPGDWDGWHTYEDVAWMAFDAAENPFSGEAGSVSAGDAWEEVSFSEVFDEVPTVYAMVVTENESDIGWIDLQNVDIDGFEVRFEELLAAGWDGVHIDETIVWFTVGGGGTQVYSEVEYQQGTTSRNNGWGQVYFGEEFGAGADVAVFTQIQSEAHSDYSHIDLKDVEEDGFYLRVEEDRGVDLSWMNGGHTYEEVGWLAVDLDVLPDGVQGGMENFRQNWPLYVYTHSVTFDEPFDPGTEVVVLAEIQTENGGHTVEVEIISVDENGFEMEIMENVGNGTPGDWDGAHTHEDVAWIAFDAAENPFGGEAGSVSAGDAWVEVSFGTVFDEVPTVFAMVITENETDIGWIDLQNVDVDGFEVRLEELLAAGWDGVHVDETIVWFTIMEVEEELQIAAAEGFYYHQDHLGGASVITDESGEVVQVLDYYPYGGTYLARSYDDALFDTNYKYTDQELDAETGLYYYGARYYDTDVGRFMSQDPAVYDERLLTLLKDPQMLNGYAYVGGNPVKYVDENGEAAFLAVFAGMTIADVVAAAVVVTAAYALTQVDTAAVAEAITTTVNEALDSVFVNEPAVAETSSVVFTPVNTETGIGTTTLPGSAEAMDINIETIPNVESEKGSNVSEWRWESGQSSNRTSEKEKYSQDRNVQKRDNYNRKQPKSGKQRKKEIKQKRRQKKDN